MNARDLMTTLVPTDWSGEDALRMVDLLRQAIDAIWRVHGPSMAEILHDPEETDAGAEEEIPF